MSQNAPKSIAAEILSRRIEERFAPLGSLSDRAIKAILFYRKEVLGLSNTKLIVDVTKKEVVIFVYDFNDKRFFFKPKDSGVVEKMRNYFGMKDYIVRFSERGEQYIE